MLSTCNKLPHGFKIFVSSIFGWPPKTGFTVLSASSNSVSFISSYLLV